MKATTKFGTALVVLALFAFQPFSQCFATPARAMPHDCCPAAKKAECGMASCVCDGTATTAAVPLSAHTGQPLTAVVGNAPDSAVPVRRAPGQEGFSLSPDDRFIVLRQLLI